MDQNNLNPAPESGTVIPVEQQIEKVDVAISNEFSSGSKKKYIRFTMAVLGSIPWIGSFISAAASLSAEKDQDKINELLKLWLMEHKDKIDKLNLTLTEIFARLDNFGEEIQKRIESPEYLTLVRTTFKSWDNAETEDKRQMLKKLISNAGVTTLCPDDLVRLFIKWIDQYHESHFLVIKEIYQNQGISRGQMWDKIHKGPRPAENSSEADLFKYLIRELNTGGVIRIERETNEYGQFIRKQPQYHPKGSASKTMESAFEETKPYVLTELGEEFVHYVMTDIVPQIADNNTP